MRSSQFVADFNRRLVTEKSVRREARRAFANEASGRTKGKKKGKKRVPCPNEMSGQLRTANATVSERLRKRV